MRKQLVLIGVVLFFLGCNDNKPAIVKSTPSPTSSSVITNVSPSVTPTSTPTPIEEKKDLCEVTSMENFKSLFEFVYKDNISGNDFKYNPNGEVYGFVYDNKGNPLTDAKITIIPFFGIFDYYNQKQINGIITNEDLISLVKNTNSFTHIKTVCNSYKFNLSTRTDQKGYYSFKVGYYSFYYYIRVEKDGFAPRVRFSEFKERTDYADFGKEKKSQYFNDSDYLSYIAPQDAPEINNFLINYNRLDKSLTTSIIGITLKTSTEPRLKIKQEKNDYEMVLTFSEAVKKDTVNENLQILSLVDSKVILDKSNITLTWVDDVTVKANFSIDKKGKYNIIFKKPFEDLNGNKAISDRYFRVPLIQRSENIIFEII